MRRRSEKKEIHIYKSQKQEFLLKIIFKMLKSKVVWRTVLTQHTITEEIIPHFHRPCTYSLIYTYVESETWYVYEREHSVRSADVVVYAARTTKYRKRE